jgi:alpha-1,6-mannosyltransferase
MVSHESVTALLKLTLLGPGLSRGVADWLNRRTARAFAGFLSGRADLATLLASADVAIAPGPAETFGLAALEALARPERSRRAAARARAEQYDWGTAARGFLAAHGAEDSAAVRRRSA